MSQKNQSFGIIVSGGPAPGINSVISSCVIEAVNSGYRVKGAHEGFLGIVEKGEAAFEELSIQRVVPHAAAGGSLLGISRFNPFQDDTAEARFKSALLQAGIDKLIVIGGEGSAYLSRMIALRCPGVKVVHVPKTIDNDLVLPNQHPSFGFETARSIGTEIVSTLITDARTCQRWFLVTSMGRKSGFLALGLGLAAGATLTIIPEEFSGVRPTPAAIASIILGSMKRRASEGKEYGVAILAEGLLDQLDPTTSPLLRDVPRDELGRIRYSDLELGDVIIPVLREQVKQVGLDMRIIGKNIGYELRCHSPVSFDIEYTKFLGFGAVRLLLEGKSGVMVTRDFDHIGATPLEELALPDGSIRSRHVSLESDYYRVARSFMIR